MCATQNLRDRTNLHSYSYSKSSGVIETVLKPQWWVNYKPLAEEAIKCTQAGELTIDPKSPENEWYRWLEGIQDWCISRQLWWGHRCPVAFVRIGGQKQDVRIPLTFDFLRSLITKSGQ